MKIKSCLGLLAALILGSVPLASASGQAKEDPAHAELRNVLKEMKAAHNADDLEKLVSFLDDNVVVTWQNAKVTKGPKEVKDYYIAMTKGPDRVVQKSTIKPEADDLSFMHNDSNTAIAWGHSKDHYLLTDGTEFDQDTRWSATVVKKDGKWKVASVHISVNMFDNPILNIAIKKAGIWIGGIAGVVGLVLGLIVGMVLFRRGAKQPTA